MILAQVDAQVAAGDDDGRYHLVAPPGSGKTVVGLELIRRFDAPAVVFAPTTVIQQQWQQQLGQFTAEPAPGLCSLSPDKLAPINIFTYQLISTPGQAQGHTRDMALQRWQDELLLEGQATDEGAAKARLQLLRQNNPRGFDSEVARRYNRIKRELLTGDPQQVERFLHPNARRLIKGLVDYGVRTIVLDECHHLLDYWAIVLRFLISSIDTPLVIGLTATLPDPENEKEFENYSTLLGEVDFEVPTPAVVKEGDLAPYRDFAYFVQPTVRERDYLQNVQQAFEDAIAGLTGSTAFRNWVVALVVERRQADNSVLPWAEFLQRHPLLSIAALRFFLSQASLRVEHSLPEGELPVEAIDDPAFDDWCILLERFALDVLSVSADAGDHRQLRELKRALLPFGLTLTERGLRQSRSPGDLVLALSEAKDEATAHILAQEMKALGDRLRAVVVTDFERMTSGARRLRGVLEDDAGSAWRVFRHLACDFQVAELAPVLVTGSTVMVPTDYSLRLLEAFNTFLQSNGLNARCECRATAWPQVQEVVGEGRDWSSRVYVRMATQAFEEGLTLCLIGTRGIFGEGWDARGLNTLIDLTGTTTSTSVQQLRGRTLRKDPNWPRKVAHHWDVICVAPEFERGNSDLQRFQQRHRRFWGVTRDGHIARGVAHVDADLAYELAVREWSQLDLSVYTQRMLQEVQNEGEARGHSYDLWEVGGAYNEAEYSVARIQTSDLKIRTVWTLQNTLSNVVASFRSSAIAGVMAAGLQGAALLQAPAMALPAGAALGSIVIGTLLSNVQSARRLAKTELAVQSPSTVLLDAGRALLGAMQELKLLHTELTPENVIVTTQGDGSCSIELAKATPVEAALFVGACRELFAPVRDQRYLILRDDARLPTTTLSPLWRMLRPKVIGEQEYQSAYHPVPEILATHKDRAECFARWWTMYVGGGELVFTRSEAGRKVLLQARAQRRPQAPSLAFEIWR